jgi:hypothetical protein
MSIIQEHRLLMQREVRFSNTMNAKCKQDRCAHIDK